MGPEELKTLSEGGAWVVLAGVLVWIINYLLKQAARERQEQELRHRRERHLLLQSHRAERCSWQRSAEQSADKIAAAVERALSNRP